MSFILDALRKSDAERQRAATPGLADVRYAARRSRRNIWLPILVVVLVANMLFMGVQWFGRGSPAPAPSVAPPAAIPEPLAAGPPAVQPAVQPAPAAEIRPLARETEFGEPPLEPVVEGEFATAPAVAESAERPTPGQQTAPELMPVPAAPPLSSTPSRILAGDDLPTVEELIGSGKLNIPMLNLDLHVYSPKPAGRFVVINTRKYKEGGQLSEGPTIESITSDGVILTSQGRRFTLARK